MKIVNDRFDSITYGISDNNVFDMIEKISDCIDIRKRLLMIIHACNELVRNNDELRKRKRERETEIDSIRALVRQLLRVVIWSIRFGSVEEMVQLIEKLIIIDFLF